jgi:hypothetical protein
MHRCMLVCDPACGTHSGVVASSPTQASIDVRADAMTSIRYANMHIITSLPSCALQCEVDGAGCGRLAALRGLCASTCAPLSEVRGLHTDAHARYHPFTVINSSAAHAPCALTQEQMREAHSDRTHRWRGRTNRGDRTTALKSVDG